MRSQFDWFPAGTFCVETKRATVVTAYLAGKAIFAVVLSQSCRIMFRHKQFAFKAGPGDKGHSLFFLYVAFFGEFILFLYSAVRHSIFDIRIFSMPHSSYCARPCQKHILCSWPAIFKITFSCSDFFGQTQNGFLIICCFYNNNTLWRL
jgi:hypothetical protein